MNLALALAQSALPWLLQPGVTAAAPRLPLALANSDKHPTSSSSAESAAVMADDELRLRLGVSRQVLQLLLHVLR